MGTLFRIVLYAPDAAAARAAADAAFARIATLDHIMSDYRADSELTRLSQHAGGPPLAVSQDLWNVLGRAQEISRQTRGAFDVTIGPLVLLWRRARREHELPDPPEIAAARKLVGFRLIHLDSAHRTVQLSKPGMRLDLGGIAKGYAADEALALLKRRGLTRALVAAGGDIALGDAPPGIHGWRIGIEDLEKPGGTPSQYVRLASAGISTSGDSEQHVEIQGIRYSHIIDPRTARALTGARSATVIAPNDAAADALATAACVLGPEAASKVIRSTPGVALLYKGNIANGEQDLEVSFPPFDGKTP
jgi:FAD:protein FMN transferase